MSTLPNTSFSEPHLEVVEGAAQVQENQTSSVASRDVFHFSDEQLVEITSFVIALNKRELHSRPSLD